MMRFKTGNGFPPVQEMYDRTHEHDACGIGFVAMLRGRLSPRGLG